MMPFLYVSDCPSYEAKTKKLEYNHHRMSKNKEELKNFIIITLLISVIFTFVFYLLFHLFVYLFFIRSESYISSGIGAFMGAFSAFIFLIIEKTFSKYRERRKIHFNALVRAEYLLNENLQLTSDNIYMVDGLIKVLKKGALHIGGFNQLVWDQSILLNLANLDMINNLSSYAITVRKVNRDLDMLEKWYEQLKLALIQKNIDKTTYDINITVLIKQLEVIRKFLIKADDETLVRQSEVRVMMKERNFIDWFFDKISDHRFPNDFEERVQKEQKVLEKERNDTRIAWQKDIENME